MIHLGNVPANSILYIPFATYNSAGASVTMSGFATSDIKIYKDGGTTERASTSGFALLDTDGIDFDSVTGLHGFSIDLSDNTTAGFYAVGSQYWVVVSAITADSQTVTLIAATFRIVAAEAITGKPKVDVDGFGGTAGTFSAGRPEVNTTHAAGTAWASGAIVAGAIATGAITNAKFAAGAIDAAAVADGAIDAGAFAADTITAAKIAADVGTEIGTAVWATATRVLTANTNLNDLNAAGIRTALGMASANLDTQLATIAAYIDTEIAAILADTGTTLDGKLDAIKAVTDAFVFSVAGKVDANIKNVADIAVNGVGSAIDPWGP